MELPRRRGAVQFCDKVVNSTCLGYILFAIILVHVDVISGIGNFEREREEDGFGHRSA